MTEEVGKEKEEKKGGEGEKTSIEVHPDDEYNRELIDQVHPPNWANPEAKEMYNLVVIGGGTAGLVAAAGAAGLGATVAMVEKNLLGGDCLNWGCVPSKSIIRSGRAAYNLRASDQYGVKGMDPEVDFSKVMERMRRIRAQISHHDSAERFQDLGVDVFLGPGKFAGSHEVEVNGQILKFRKAVIATGARAFIPPVEGLEEAGYVTNEGLFELTEQPESMLFIGGGPIGCEMAQTFQRLGTEITIVEMMDQFLTREDQDAAEILKEQFEREGIEIHLKTKVARVEKSGDKKKVTLATPGGEKTLEVDEILVGAGRIPNIEGLNLEAAGVEYDSKKGIEVNDYLQTSASHIYASGDVCLKYKFTHVADAASRIILQNALFPGFKKSVDSLIVPWCTYTDPEIAHVGMYPHMADEKGIEIETFKVDFSDVDRALAEGEEEGFVKIHVKKGSDKILGATIVARHAGEIISEITTAMVGEMGLKTLANVIHPYPTQAEAIKKIADEFNRTRLTPFIKKILGWWMAWQR